MILLFCLVILLACTRKEDHSELTELKDNNNTEHLPEETPIIAIDNSDVFTAKHYSELNYITNDEIKDGQIIEIINSGVKIKPNSVTNFKIKDYFSINNEGGEPFFEDMDYIYERKYYKNNEIKFLMYYSMKPFSIEGYNNYSKYMQENGHPLFGYIKNGKIYFIIN